MTLVPSCLLRHLSIRLSWWLAKRRHDPQGSTGGWLPWGSSQTRPRLEMATMAKLHARPSLQYRYEHYDPSRGTPA
jgi:hypothetical protein